jgi:hypothetical protein
MFGYEFKCRLAVCNKNLPVPSRFVIPISILRVSPYTKAKKRVARKCLSKKILQIRHSCLISGDDLVTRLFRGEEKIVIIN